MKDARANGVQRAHSIGEGLGVGAASLDLAGDKQDGIDFGLFFRRESFCGHGYTFCQVSITQPNFGEERRGGKSFVGSRLL